MLLRRASDGDILFGIELKGWYLLAKEREPSLRFQVTEAACDSTADEDAHAALARLKDRVGEDNRASSVAGSALAIVNALEALLEATGGRSG